MLETEKAPQLLHHLPQLNPRLDRAVLANEYRRRGRIQIDNVLTDPSAKRIHYCLSAETQFALCYNNGDVERSAVNLSPQQRQECTKAAWQRVGLKRFQFLFEQHTLSLNGEAYIDLRHYWATVTSFLNGTEFLDFVREITGAKGIEFADAQATLYRGGHFLTAHDDNREGPKRLVAYVLSFTPSWRPEWGGVLEFVDETGQVETGYVPSFNSLKLFRVPMNHYVSYVAPYATAGRYSITGWLRAR